jgi:hypothetical protein
LAGGGGGGIESSPESSSELCEPSSESESEEYAYSGFAIGFGFGAIASGSILRFFACGPGGLGRRPRTASAGRGFWITGIFGRVRVVVVLFRLPRLTESGFGIIFTVQKTKKKHTKFFGNKRILRAFM